MIEVDAQISILDICGQGYKSSQIYSEHRGDYFFFIDALRKKLELSHVQYRATHFKIG